MNGEEETKIVQQIDAPANSSLDNRVDQEVGTNTVTLKDAPANSSLGNKGDQEVDTNTVTQIDFPTNSCPRTSKSPKQVPPSTRQTRSMTRKVQTSAGKSTKKVDSDAPESKSTKRDVSGKPKGESTKQVNSDVPEDDILASGDKIGAGVSQPEIRRKSSRRSGKGIKRKKEPTYLPRANNASAFQASWSETDKRRLLVALQRFGILEIDKLVKSVPGKSEKEIRKFVAIRWKLARTELRAHLRETRKSKGENSSYLGPVDKWLELLAHFYPNYDHYKVNPIAHAMLLIWKFEKHPDPSECGGVDFKALYEYMYFMLCGYPPKHLNQPTATFLSETLKNFAGRIKNGNWSEIVQHLNYPMEVNYSERPPVSEDKIIAALSYSKEKCIEELSKLSGFNPFSIPSNLLKKKDGPDTVNLKGSS